MVDKNCFINGYRKSKTEILMLQAREESYLFAFWYSQKGTK